MGVNDLTNANLIPLARAANSLRGWQLSSYKVPSLYDAIVGISKMVIGIIIMIIGIILIIIRIIIKIMYIVQIKIIMVSKLIARLAALVLQGPLIIRGHRRDKQDYRRDNHNNH